MKLGLTDIQYNSLLTVLQDLAGSVDTNMLQEKQSVDNNYTLKRVNNFVFSANFFA